MSDDAKKTRVHVEIDPEIHYMMRVQAVKEKKTLRQFVEMLIVRYVEQLNETSIHNG
jgi:predicted HicB family RNase H-like nuclease